MNKRGTHVDWVISIGIFLVYLLAIIVFVKPGIVPLYDYETLLDVTEENVRNDVNTDIEHFGGAYWTLYETPLFIKNLHVSNCIEVPFPFEWGSQSTITLYSPDDMNIPLPFTKADDNIIICIEGAPSKEDFILHFSDNEIYSERDGIIYGSSVLKIEEDCGGEEYIAKKGEDTFTYSYGITEPVRGISQFVLDEVVKNINLKETHIYNGKEMTRYDLLKILYKYPLSKEFAAYVYVDPEDPHILEYYPPDPTANVYVREWSDFILHYNGVRKPIKVSIRVW